MYDEVGNFIMWNDFVRIETDIPSVFVENYATNNGSFHHGVVKGLGSHEVSQFTFVKLSVDLTVVSHR